MRVTYLDGYSYVGIGINLDGEAGMIPALAVIGRLEDDGSGALSVMRYSLFSDDRDASGVWPLDDVHGQLKEGSTFVQNENGQSVLEFTHSAQILDENDGTVLHTVSADTVWIWAVGLADNAWQGKHTLDGAFSGLQMPDGCQSTGGGSETTTPSTPVDSTPESTTSPTEADSGFAATNEPIEGDESEDEDEEQQSGGGGGQGSNVSGESSEFITDETEASSTRSLWIAHGILLGTAWGVFAPLAIGASYLRNSFNCLKNNGFWFQLHFALIMLVAVLTACGFFLAVVATQKDEDPHFQEETHKKAGLTIFILVLFQILAGYFRPGLPKAKTVAASSPESSPSMSPKTARGSKSPRTSVQTEEDSMEVVEEALQQQKTSRGRDPSHVVSESSLNPSTPLPPKKSRLRQGWEYLHRFLGMTLLGLSWYACQSGIVIWAEDNDPDDEEKLLKIFWGITGGIACTIFLIGYVIRVE